MKKFELGSKKIEAEMELKRAEMEQKCTFQKDAMVLKQKEIDTKVKSIEFQISQHQDDMRKRFLEMEQKLEDGNKNYFFSLMLCCSLKINVTD